MDRNDYINAFHDEMEKVMTRWRNVGMLTYAEYIGVLEHLKMNMYFESRDKQKEGDA